MNSRVSHGHRLLRILAAFLCALLICSLFPLTAFAWPTGSQVSSWYGDSVVGSHGGAFQHPGSWSVLIYGADGTQTGKTIRGGGDYRHFTLTDSSGDTRWVYCVEAGLNFTTADSAYTVDSGYLGRLPATAQQGIKLAALYGWKPGASTPAGNANDYYMATQVIIWEYQQQLRADAHSRHSNGVADANQFYNIIAGTAAETCYNWILDRIASHNTVPSFTSTSSGSAPTHELKWDTKDKVYRLTLTDTNNLGIDLQALSGHPNVTITRSGNRYTITSTKMIMDPVTFQFRKNVPTGDAIVIWGRPGYQTMMTGAEDPVVFYAKIKTETYGWARLIKTSEDGIVSGIRLNISGTDILGNKVNTDVTTGANGRVDAKLLPGTYLVKEHPIDRYVTPPPQYVTIESGQVSEVHFTNILKKFRVQLTKTDAHTGVVQGDASLAGAVYGLYKGDQLMDTYTTDVNGQFMTRYYVCGTDWTIRELTPSTGYLLDTTVHPVGADARLYEVELNTTENHVTEVVKYGYVRLIKHTDDWDEDILAEEQDESDSAGMIEQPEAGATFEIFLRSAGSYANAKETERDILTTDADGIATSKQLPYGYYTVHQTAAGPAGANKNFIPDFTVFVSQDGFTYSYILKNDTIFGRLKVEKRDAETGQIIPIGGVGFKVRDLDTGEFITQRVWYPNPIDIDTYYTSDEGWLMLPDALPKNTAGYELIEVQAPHGYVLDGNPIPFTIDGSESVVTVVQQNTPQKGTITITKTGEVFSSVVENEGFYQPVYAAMGLPGAVYDIIADEDIYTGDGTLRYAKDTVVETLTTGADAKATSGQLYLGKFRLVERQAPVGMVLALDPVFVELAYAGQEVEVTHTDLGIYDERQKVAVDLVKAMETDELFGIGLGDEYKNISFGLYAATDIVALDGATIPADGLIEVVSLEPITDGQVPAEGAEGAGGESGAQADGKTWRMLAGAFSSDLPFGSFYVQERATNSQHVLNDTQYPVVFACQGQDVAVVSVAVNEGKAVENELIRGDVEGIKLGEQQGEPSGDAKKEGKEPDPYAGRRLAGALIGLFRPEDEKMTRETALMTTRSAEDGSFGFTGIPHGHWVIKEIAPPTAYTLSPEIHHVYIGVDGQLSTIRIENTLIRGAVQLVKTDADRPGEKLPGAVFELYADTNGDKKLDTSDILLGELDEPDSGVHERRGLVYGGYFIKEKTAPASYKADENVYYFEIREDGDFILIENNKDGKGFTNEAQKGNLRIKKSSSDGTLAGFSFKVEGEGYSKVFETGANGEIMIEGLRVGKYTVSEVENKASAGYTRPKPVTVEVKTGETVEITMRNEKPTPPTNPPNRPTTPTTPAKPTPPPDTKVVPKTNDSGAIVVWAILFGITALGGTVLIVRAVKRRKKAGRNALAVFSVTLCIAMAAGSGAMFVGEVLGYRQGADTYAELGRYVSPGKPCGDAGTGDSDGPQLPNIDFEALRTINPDIAGWLWCENTPINYPVVQGENNSFYLNHLFDGTKNKAGCLFVDSANMPLEDGNTVIYGHNMLDGSMLSSIVAYTEQAYYDAHPILYLLTPSGNYAMELFSGYTAATNADAWTLTWDNEDRYGQWLADTKNQSQFESEGVTLSPQDKVMTLSTCTNGGRDRFVVVGRLTALP